MRTVLWAARIEELPNPAHEQAGAATESGSMTKDQRLAPRVLRRTGTPLRSLRMPS